MIAYLPILATALAQQQLSQGPGPADEVLQKVRAAVHYEDWSKSDRALILTGVVKRDGVSITYALQFDPKGRWFDKDAPPLASVGAFDGERYWAADATGATVPDSMGRAAEDRYMHALETDLWLSIPSSQVSRIDDDDVYRLYFKFKDTDLPAFVTVSKRTCLPIRASVPGPFAEVAVKFRDWKSAAGLLVPSAFEEKVQGERTNTSVTGADLADSDPDSLYREPAWVPTDTTFDAYAPTAVPTKRSDDGHILVQPLLNGRDVGWFLLDTGASAMFIDKSVAQDLGLKKLAPTRITGLGGQTAGFRCKVDSFSLGPLTVRDLPLDAMDASMATKALGLQVAGTIGYDLFRRAVIVVPGGTGDVRITAAIAKPLDAHALRFEEGIPFVHLECERGDGWFMLDTGYDGPVTFFEPFVQKTHLLDGRDVKSGKAQGVGGDAPFKVGQIGWAAFGGNRVRDPVAVFSSATSGVWADRYAAGSIGQYTLKLFDVTFDYGGAGATFTPAAGVTCIGDDTGRAFTSPGPDWVFVGTLKTFYERHLDPGETVSIDVLAPDKVTLVAAGLSHDRYDELENHKGVRVTFTRPAGP
jgi:hypothetical protein